VGSNCIRRELESCPRLPIAARAAVDYVWLQRELPKIGVTLQLLWTEYEQAALARSEHPYRYGQFCGLFALWRGDDG
jgi:hypothetical protein